jgi:hypothetical protein
VEGVLTAIPASFPARKPGLEKGTFWRSHKPH